MGLCRTTIYKWLRTYRRKGEAGLARRKITGRKPRLDSRQRQQVRRWIIGHDPRQYGFDFGLWTRKIVAELIFQKFGVHLKLTAIGRLLASLEITPQKPLRRAYERDPKRISEWMTGEYPKLRSRAKRRSAEIFFLDEAGLRSDAALGRTYGLKGQTPIVKTSGQRQKVNAISAVNARGGFWYSVYTGNFNAARFVEFLKMFLRGRRKKVFLVVDGHPSHHAKLVARFVQSTRGQLEIHFLPPYAPDLNPDEFVWNYLRQKGVSKTPLRQNESLKNRVIQDLESVKSNKPLIRSFFHAKSVAYLKD
jgi:transposase